MKSIFVIGTEVDNIQGEKAARDPLANPPEFPWNDGRLPKNMVFYKTTISEQHSTRIRPDSG